MYACMSACRSVGRYACEYTLNLIPGHSVAENINIYIYIIYTTMCVCKWINKCMHISTHMINNMINHMSVNVYAFFHKTCMICISIYIYTYIYIYAYIYKCVYIYMNVYIYIHIYIFINVYI